MAESSSFWNGTAVGDASIAPYDAPTEFSNFMAAAVGSVGTVNNGGVSRSYIVTNNLAVSGAASPVSVQSGYAFVNGTYYRNDAALSVAIPTPAGATRIDRIVLRKSWAAQTIRITRIVGVEGGGIPALSQVLGTTWDIPLATVYITVGGVITVVDEREFLPSGAGTVLITTGTLGADAAQIDIANIPQYFKDLRLILSLRSDLGVLSSTASLRFNGDAGLNYDYIVMTNTGLALGQNGVSGIGVAFIGSICSAVSPANDFTPIEVLIPGYSSTIKLKKAMFNCGWSPEIMSGMASWNVTSAITGITIIDVSPANLVIGSSYALYGTM